MTDYVTLNYHTYSSGTSDEGTGIRYLDNGGHWANFIPLVQDILTVADQVNTNSSLVLGNVATTSTSSVAIGLGSKSFTVAEGLSNFLAGNYVRINAADPVNYMYGVITSYTTTTLVVDVQVVGGSGTFASWNLTLAGVRGATGATGAAGTNGTNGIIDATNQTGLLKGDGSTISPVVSGTDIKTLGGLSVLGAGNIPLYSPSELTFLIG